MGIAGHITQKI